MCVYRFFTQGSGTDQNMYAQYFLLYRTDSSCTRALLSSQDELQEDDNGGKPSDREKQPHRMQER